jgi:hypothetical protein
LWIRCLQNLGDIEVNVVADVQEEVSGSSVQVHVTILELHELGIIPIAHQTDDDLLVRNGINQSLLDHIVLALFLEPRNKCKH